MTRSLPPLVLLHGFPFTHEMWLPQIQALGPDVEVVTPDLPGFGGALAFKNPNTMGYMADAVHSYLMERNLRRVTLCGLSMGGYVALEFAQRYPEHLDRLILAATRASPDSPAAAKLRTQQAQDILAHGMQSLTQTMLAKLFRPEGDPGYPGARDLIERLMLGAPPEAVSATLLGLALRQDHQANLSRLEVPTLVIAGRHDPIISLDEAHAMAQALPHGRLEIFEASAHLPNLEEPQRFNASVKAFLAGVSGGI